MDALCIGRHGPLEPLSTTPGGAKVGQDRRKGHRVFVNITRHTHTTERSACAVCGVHDERALSTLKLALGTRVIVCGTHDLVYRRSGQTASTVEELRAIARDRRGDQSARRDEGDELGAQLAAAFVNEKRSGQDRRR